MTQQTYRIVRFFKDVERAGAARRIILTGRTLEQVQAHCNGIQTSSSTCTMRAARNRTKLMGPWFDGYEREP